MENFKYFLLKSLVVIALAVPFAAAAALGYYIWWQYSTYVECQNLGGVPVSYACLRAEAVIDLDA